MKGHRPANRLAAESSPYLKQHGHNPVDWFPWGEEAFDKARREDKPIFLSIGYSSCHWCHVMERESFENEEIAGVLNDRFVSIKVDREERPDVDDVYMTSVQLTTGRGGWPLSAFLLPDGRAFFGGTYFPPDDRHGRAGFRTLLLRLSDAFRTRRSQVEETAANLSAEVASATSVGEKHRGKAPDAEALDTLTTALARAFDAEHGGFGGAPKFPPHIALEWLLREAARGNTEAGRLAERTLEAMALGGIHDHLGGGFHRYSTDERWLLPHFEKMLSDNAQLLAAYANAYALTGRALYRRVALAAGEYLLREMRGPEGAFYAATDADSEGEEGKFFVWSEAEVRGALGDEDAALFCRVYQVRAEGNYHDESSGRSAGLNVLHLREEPSEAEEARLAPLRAELLALRSRRVPPGLDDKRISGWNALAVSGLATAARALDDRRFLEAARTAATFLLTIARDAEGRLLRTWKEGGRIPAFLEDEAYLANALLDLAEADAEGGAEWLAEAARAAGSLTSRFRGRGEAGFTFTGEGHERLVATTRDLFDKATPSASGSAVRALVRLALATGDRRLAADARAALEEVSTLLARSPHGTETWYLAAADLLEFERGHGSVEAAPTGRGATSARGPVTLELLATPARLKRGGTLALAVTVRIAEGTTLQADAPLPIEAWAGGDLEVTSRRVPEPGAVRYEDGTEGRGYAGDVKADLTLTAAPDAARGERPVTVIVRYVACGGGACEPEAALSAAVPVTIGA